jgi:hypothetical protein
MQGITGITDIKIRRFPRGYFVESPNRRKDRQKKQRAFAVFDGARSVEATGKN